MNFEKYLAEVMASRVKQKNDYDYYMAIEQAEHQFQDCRLKVDFN